MYSSDNSQYIILDFYPSPFGNVLTELIYLGLTVMYAIRIIHMFKKSWFHPKSKGYFNHNQEVGNHDLFSRAINYPIEKVPGLFQFILILSGRVVDLALKCIKTFVTFLKLYTLFLFQLISIVLTVISIMNWIVVIYKSTSQDLQYSLLYGLIPIDREVTYFNALERYAAALSNYRRIQGINGIFIVCGISPYLRFSMTMSSVISVVRLAKSKVVSYLVIFFVIMFGYGIAGFMIYGDQMTVFSSILRSSLEMILAIMGGIKYQEMKQIFPILTPFFVFSYLLLAYTIFLKTFLLILQAEYNDYYECYLAVSYDLPSKERIFWR